jgi:predicted O-methyltransferase YrrM
MGDQQPRWTGRAARYAEALGFDPDTGEKTEARLPVWDQEASAPEQVELLCALIRCQRPEILVEAGTYRGHAAYHIGKVLQSLDFGHLHTADPVPNGQMATLSGFKRVTFYPRDFLKVLEGIPAVDFAYIDASDHSKPGGAGLRWLHFEAVRAKLRPGGIICVDDTAADDWNDGEGGLSVHRIRDLCLNFTFLRGLSVFTCT